jgi:hypothetical protein
MGVGWDRRGNDEGWAVFYWDRENKTRLRRTLRWHYRKKDRKGTVSVGVIADVELNGLVRRCCGIYSTEEGCAAAKTIQLQSDIQQSIGVVKLRRLLSGVERGSQAARMD